MAAYIIALLIMLMASVEDLARKEISMWIIIFGGVISLFMSIWRFIVEAYGPKDIVEGLIPGIIILVLAFISREGIGYGDGLLLLTIGPVFGIKSEVIGLMIAFFTSGIVSAFLLMIKRTGKRYTIPFVPFMTLGMGVSLFAQI